MQPDIGLQHVGVPVRDRFAIVKVFRNRNRVLNTKAAFSRPENDLPKSPNISQTPPFAQLPGNVLVFSEPFLLTVARLLLQNSLSKPSVQCLAYNSPEGGVELASEGLEAAGAWASFTQHKPRVRPQF